MANIDNETITIGELAEALQRHDFGLASDQATLRAHLILGDVKSHREPKYHVGDVVVDANGQVFWRSYNNYWLRFGYSEQVPDSYPARPLRRLVAETVLDTVDLHTHPGNDDENLREY